MRRGRKAVAGKDQWFLQEMHNAQRRTNRIVTMVKMKIICNAVSSDHEFETAHYRRLLLGLLCRFSS
jgi:hypothetical protein